MSQERFGDWMQTVSGVKFWPLDPRANEVRIIDIAHALSQICRYNGHCRGFYSVAEHSVLVSQVIEPEFALWGLLHDAAEAYLGDVIRPIKPYIAQYKTRENRVMHCIAAYLNLGFQPSESVKRADNAVLAAEAKVVFDQDMSAHWKLSEPPAAVKVQFLNPMLARELFLERFYRLTFGKLYA